MTRARALRALEVSALAALLLLAAGWFWRPVADVDFWWHLAAGRHIVATGAVPAVDPTGMYDAANYWAQTVLRGQWLGQVAIYAAYAAGGFDGVAMLRAAILVACLAVAMLRMRRAGAATAPLVAVAFVLVMVLRGHLGERPQLLSFLFFGLAVLIAEIAAAPARRRALLTLPPLFLLWANCHPGAILGAVALGAWCVLGALETVWREGRLAPAALRLPAVALAGAWLATLATPNGLVSYEYLLRLESDPLRERVSEYQSPLALAGDWQLAPSLPWYFALALLALGAVAVLLWQRRLRDAGVLALLLGVSLSAYRYIPFFALYAAPLLARALGERVEASKRWAVPAAAAALLAAATLLTWGAAQGALFRGGIAAGLYPVELVRSLAASGAAGRAFNTLNWGGYLGWELAGRVTPYIDGRMMEPARVRPYTHILWMTPEGRDAFERARFDIVLIPHRNALAPAQGAYPLAAYLARHPEWRLAGRDAKGMLFLRRRPPGPARLRSPARAGRAGRRACRGTRSSRRSAGA